MQVAQDGRERVKEEVVVVPRFAGDAFEFGKEGVVETLRGEIAGELGEEAIFVDADMPRPINLGVPLLECVYRATVFQKGGAADETKAVGIEFVLRARVRVHEI